MAMKLVPCALGPSLTLEEAQKLASNFLSATAFPEKTSEIALGNFGSLTLVAPIFCLLMTSSRASSCAQSRSGFARADRYVSETLSYSGWFYLLLVSVSAQSLLYASQRS